MKYIFRYMKPYGFAVGLAIAVKLLVAMVELLLPYILEYIIDVTVPGGELRQILLWGFLMIATSVLARFLNVSANRRAVENAHNVSYHVRQDLFTRTENLSGNQFDQFGLPSLISRMTSDSYNVQSCVQSLQTLCVRAPVLLIGGIAVTLTMDWVLAAILCIMLPVMLAVVIAVSRYGIPLYNKVQERLDDVVRVMRENITGIRVVKALSKEKYEKSRFAKSNDDMTASDIKAGTVMALPGPIMQISLNVGLTVVVFVGAMRVNGGQMQPGVILAFLTYFNMILQGVMSINRIFMMISKASASANRIGRILDTETDQAVLAPEEALQPGGDEQIRFEHVYFRCLEDIHFTLRRGESLGIIGPTGCGKTTIINLLMRFYDADSGGIFVDGRDVRSYEKDVLHRKFGVVFQNDMVFHDTLRRNITFGRETDEAHVQQAVEDAMAAEFIRNFEDGLEHEADIKGANLSGGQKQRLLIARALAARPEILVLDDASSALDYKTDAALRRALAAHYRDTTTVMIAQRVSSVMHMTHIMVLDNGKCIGYGDHDTLLRTCPAYREIFDTQMGALA